MPEPAFMDLLRLHVGYVLSSLLIVAVFAAVLFATAYACVLWDTYRERHPRKEAHSGR